MCSIISAAAQNKNCRAGVLSLMGFISQLEYMLLLSLQMYLRSASKPISPSAHYSLWSTLNHQPFAQFHFLPNRSEQAE